jgi:hypothetical protein
MELWLGYDNLTVRYDTVSAILLYQHALDRRILGAYGRIPPNIRAVVVTNDGRYWPSSWRAEQLRARLMHWRTFAIG